MTETIDAVAADRALKAKHRAMWAMGDYPAVAHEIIPSLGPILVDAAGIAAGDRVLDVAAGSGNAAIPAAQRGANVVASDLTPELLEIGRRRAKDAGVDLDWVEADAEALPFADGTFDATMAVLSDHHWQDASPGCASCTASGGAPWSSSGIPATPASSGWRATTCRRSRAPSGSRSPRPRRRWAPRAGSPCRSRTTAATAS